MASSLLARAAAGLRSCQPSATLARGSRFYSSFRGGETRAGAGPRSPVHSPAYRFVRSASTASSVESMDASASVVQSVSRNEPVVSCDWLHSNLREPEVKVLDASWYMPDEQRNPLQEYQVAHIPGALFFDVDGISDRTSNLPHMLPSEEGFAAAVSALGIRNKDGVIVYDGKGIFSAARVWWMFRVFGHNKVWVLDGGLPQWRTSGYEVESSASSDAILKASAASEAIEKVYHGQVVGPATLMLNFSLS
ncbi:thiosulfate/3-mercaptopyruvate sulfurtransferase 2-like [Iris pallida]|uniref:3-mercaptopyruvate sulfurtransferase n=1 Tax=Iris pallida TaxID=29817 RepID=A0AAX6GVV4_IRIPA|nr:thiosulfate/3-mercaptopyruvate sulfurtransferase 2-like [Iris pallida]